MTLLDITIDPARRDPLDNIHPRASVGRQRGPKPGSQRKPKPEGVSHSGLLKVTADMGRKTRSRLVAETLHGRTANMPPFDHPSIVEGRTRYRSTVIAPDREGFVLKSGTLHAKIGGKVLKGKWKGMPIYTLTLEERATCPESCGLWRACYGNHMHLAHRIEHGQDLEDRLREEIDILAHKHHWSGFVVRLHILGDFYSEAYVRFWGAMLASYPQLHVFGYSARWERTDPIAVELVKLAIAQWDRFALRFSNAPVDTCSTVTIEHAGAKPADAIICPQQLGQTESCSTCALCWQTEKRIAFIRH